MSGKIEHTGVISQIDKEKAWVTVVQYSACTDCHAESVCRLSNQKEKIVEIPDVDSSFQIGDKVMVVGSTSLGLLAVWYAFIIPLILAVAGLAICISYFNSESVAALIAMIVLIVYFSVLYIFRDKFKRKFVFKIAPLK